MEKEKKQEINEISWEVYQKESEKYYGKALRDFMIIVTIVALTFIFG